MRRILGGKTDQSDLLSSTQETSRTTIAKTWSKMKLSLARAGVLGLSIILLYTKILNVNGINR